MEVYNSKNGKTLQDERYLQQVYDFKNKFKKLCSTRNISKTNENRTKFIALDGRTA